MSSRATTCHLTAVSRQGAGIRLLSRSRGLGGQRSSLCSRHTPSVKPVSAGYMVLEHWYISGEIWKRGISDEMLKSHCLLLLPLSSPWSSILPSSSVSPPSLSPSYPRHFLSCAPSSSASPHSSSSSSSPSSSSFFRALNLAVSWLNSPDSTLTQPTPHHHPTLTNLNPFTIFFKCSWIHDSLVKLLLTLIP